MTVALYVNWFLFIDLAIACVLNGSFLCDCTCARLVSLIYFQEREEELASIKKVDAHKFSRRKVVSNWERYEEGQEYPNSEEEKEAEEEEKVLKELLRKEPSEYCLICGNVIANVHL